MFLSRVMIALVGLLVMVGVAHAELFVCGDSNGFAQSFFRDASLSVPSNCSMVPDDLVDAQVNIIANAQLSVVRKVKLIKVVPAAPNGLATGMTQQEIDAINNAELATQAAQAALAAELTSNVACANTTLAQVEAFLDQRMATIDTLLDDRMVAIATAITNIPTVVAGGNIIIVASAMKTALQNMINEVDFRDRQILDEIDFRDRKILRCLLAARKTGK